MTTKKLTKLLALYLPYILLGLVATNLGEAWRLSDGKELGDKIIRRLYEAISSLPPMQARRVHARYMLGMKVKDIAAMEGITPSQAGKSIHAALRRLRRYFARQKWTVNL